MCKNYAQEIEHLTKLVNQVGQYGNLHMYTDDAKSIIHEVETTGSVCVCKDTYPELGFGQRDSYYAKTKRKAKDKPWAEERW